MPLVAKRSFAPQGMPCNGPRYFPALISRSASFACERANSSVSVTMQLSFGPNFFRRPRYILVNSTGETLRVRTNAASLVNGAKARSSSELNFGTSTLLSRNLAGLRSNFLPGSAGTSFTNARRLRLLASGSVGGFLFLDSEFFIVVCCSCLVDPPDTEIVWKSYPQRHRRGM